MSSIIRITLLENTIWKLLNNRTDFKDSEKSAIAKVKRDNEEKQKK